MKKTFFGNRPALCLCMAFLALSFIGCNDEKDLPLPEDAGEIMGESEGETSVILTVNAINYADSYKWYKDGAVVQNSDSRTYIAVESGNYTVAGVNETGEGKRSAEKLITIKLPTVPVNILSENYVPDPIFRKWIKDNLAGGADEYTNEQAALYTGAIDVSNRDIKNLKGIQFFSRIQKLEAFGNNLNELDLRNNVELNYLDCSIYDGAIRIDLQVSPSLDTLICNGINVGNWDFSNYPNLTVLKCNRTYTGGKLDLSNNPKLKNLECCLGSFDIIDISKNQQLEVLVCSDNYLTTIDLSNNPSLRELRIDENQIRSINISNNPLLEILDCSFNYISGSLNVKNNPNIKELYINWCQFLNVNLEEIPKLEILDCSWCFGLDLNISKNFMLHTLICGNLSERTLDLSNNKKLQVLDCSFSSLVELDLSNNHDLRYLKCEGIFIHKLDISYNRLLSYLNVRGNHLAEIKVWPTFDIVNPPLKEYFPGFSTRFVYEFTI